MADQQQQQQQRRQDQQDPAFSQQAPAQLGPRDEEFVQVVYQSDQHGSLVGVESTSLFGGGDGATSVREGNYSYGPAEMVLTVEALPVSDGHDGQASATLTPLLIGGSHHEQLSRAASTLPSVAEESTSSGPQNGDARASCTPLDGDQTANADGAISPGNGPLLEAGVGWAATNHTELDPDGQYGHDAGTQEQAALGQVSAEQQLNEQPPIYSTISRRPVRSDPNAEQQAATYDHQRDLSSVEYPNLFESQQRQESGECAQEDSNLIDYQDENQAPECHEGQLDEDDPTRINQEIGHILMRHKAGAVEKGSFRNNFRKKLGLSVSTNENDLTAYRQKLLESSNEPNNPNCERASDLASVSNSDTEQLGLPNKFKRTHSVSFNVNSSRSNRHSVDIRNLPSYLTHKRTSIVDVAKGAMSSLMSSLGGSASGSGISGSQRRDSYQDEEPIFEEPIAPTLSLGQRVAMVRKSGAEFGTVGWIGQLPDVDDDWIVGVIFDNMIGDCDGAYNGVRYFYARENYAMFVPLTTLTKTDNYIGRPETGTMLSRMSVSLKPGQLISIQRSSIRLQHCFLNAPHQRVGHDVRAVSNRLHCQCHNCGPCAHLTKQGRINALPHFGAHHLPHRKKNSLAHAAVEMLAHHHHHFHEEEEEHEEKDYEFGDNAAHACNFVRYSCCQQSGQPGHEFSTDCGMVRPELLDNLIHAPKAPHRTTMRRRPLKQRCATGSRRPRAIAGAGATARIEPARAQAAIMAADEGANTATNTLETTTSAGGFTQTNTLTSTIKSSTYNATETGEQDGNDSSYLSSSGSSGSSRSASPRQPAEAPYNYYQYDTLSFRPTTGVYNTIDSQISFMDQQRFVFRRDSAAFMQSAKPMNWNDEYAARHSPVEPGSGPIKRILRCLGCLRQTRRPRRKLSARDRVLEYRRRQSTFVPSTLAKPHEDFASHGIILPHSSGHKRGQQARPGEANSDYSSCSRSSCSSSGSSSPPGYRPGQSGAAYLDHTTFPMQMPILSAQPESGSMFNSDQQQQQQAATLTLDHGHPAANDQLKSSHEYQAHNNNNDSRPYEPQLNYGDFSFGDGYQVYKKNDCSRDSALTDLAYTDNTYKSISSNDTLKFLVDQSINEQVSLPQPLQVASGDFISPLSSSSAAHRLEHDSPNNEHVEISSLTASLPENGDVTEEDGHEDQDEQVRRTLEDLSLEANRNNEQD